MLLTLAVSVALAACSNNATVITAVPVAPTPTPTAAATATAAPTPTAAATATAAPTPTAAATTTAAPTAAGTAGSSRAAACTGTPQFKSLFADGAAELPFDVYCPVLPSDYWITTGQYTLPNGGLLMIDYANGRDFHVEVVEGNLCPGDPTDCLPPMTSVGRVWFGDLGADLYLFPATPDIHVAWVVISPELIYAFAGSGMSQATFVNLAKAIVKVPKA